MTFRLVCIISSFHIESGRARAFRHAECSIACNTTMNYIHIQMYTTYAPGGAREFFTSVILRDSRARANALGIVCREWDGRGCKARSMDREDVRRIRSTFNRDNETTAYEFARALSRAEGKKGDPDCCRARVGLIRRPRLTSSKEK